MVKEIKETLTSTVKRVLGTDKTFWENEVHSNKIVAFTMLNSAIVLVIVWILTLTGVLNVNSHTMNSVMIEGMIELLVPCILCKVLKGEKKWLKVVMVLELVIVYARVDSILTHNTVILMVIPTVLSARYFSRKFTAITAAVTTVVFGLATWFGSIYGIMDANHVVLPEGTQLTIISPHVYDAIKAAGFDQTAYTVNMMTQTFLPRWLLFALTAIICAEIAKLGHNLITEQAETAAQMTRIESELDLATNIQKSMLPSIFPAFPGHDEFDVYASMNPAREVSGDFYDMFMVDDSHLGIVIADVSGKGVPAALFMVIAKTVIKNYAQIGLHAHDVFNNANRVLCDGNKSDMFVTAWIGILNINTGHLEFANAGHNNPVICRRGGKFEYINERAGLVLAAIDGMKYTKQEIDLNTGDILYLYTDGVTEAIDADGKMYGEERLAQMLDKCTDMDMEKLCRSVRADISEFAGEAEQFDDITMLALKIKNPQISGESQGQNITVTASIDNIGEITDFVDEFMEGVRVPAKAAASVDIAIDEIVSNIAKYGYGEDNPGDVSVTVWHDDVTDLLSLRFEDSGIPYNPLEREDPDISLAVDDRDIGGLGIFMTKKLMDDMTYEFRDGKNILTVHKYL